jgi:hypothetical protein
MNSPRDTGPLVAALRAAEATGATGPLPRIIVSPGGQPVPDDLSGSARQIERLGSPALVSRFIRAAHACLPSQARAAA